MDDPYNGNLEFKEDDFAPDYVRMTVQRLDKALVKRIRHGKLLYNYKCIICNLIIGTYMMDGCSNQIQAYEQDEELVRVQVRLEEKMEEYSTPQRDMSKMKGNQYEHSFRTTVDTLVTQVSN